MSSYAKMWFGTEDKMQWIDCPLQGADVSPLGWSAEGTLLNGGGYAKHSWASHRNYVFEWRQSSARRMAQIMHNYRDGVYGRGLIHFVDPLTYDFNILPKQWAYPALMAGEANNPFLRGTALSTVATPTNTFNLPIQGAVVPLGSLSGFRATDSVFVPRPENKVLRLWGLYTIAGNATAGVYAIPVNDNGTNGTPVRLTPTALNGGTPVEYNLTTGKGVRLCVMKTSAAAGTVNLFGLVGRLANADGSPAYSWVGEVDNSASIMRNADGTEIARNLFTNPRAVESGSMVEVARNLSVQSRGVQDWGNNNAGKYVLTPNRTPPIPHPLGITTANRGKSSATNSDPHIVSIYNADGLGTGGPERGFGFWVLAMQEGYEASFSTSGMPWVPLTPGEWTFVVRPTLLAAGAWAGVMVRRADLSIPPTSHEVYVTGSIVLEGQIPTHFFDGSYNHDPDLTPHWLGAVNNSASVLEGKAVTGIAQESGAHVIQSSWVPDGQTGHSIRVIPKSTTKNAYAVFSPSGVASAATASVVVRLTAPQTGTIAYPTSARGIYWSGVTEPRVQAPNEAGETTLTLVHPDRTGALVLHNGARLGGGDVWYYLPTVVNGEHPDLVPFHGSMPSIAPGSAPLTEWLGGQGQSGARFVGSPTYIENTGVNGGQISYAASFKEVGDWQ